MLFVVLVALWIVPLHGYNVTGLLTVSGLSAGAFAAVQFHVANSNSISGSAVFAGGPYYCAQDSLEVALSSCTKDPDLIVTDDLRAFAETFADSGEIDSLDGLEDDTVFLYSGKLDSVVHPKVVKKAGDFFASYGARVVSVFNISSEHCIPTETYGNDCGKLASPYISKCGFDGAGAALNTLLQLDFAPVNAVSNNLIQFDQSKFFPSLELVLGLDSKCFVYVPSQCHNGSIACRMHVDFHGCNQQIGVIGDVYVQHAGYIEWAESNNIIVLFPQAKTEPLINPKGCFDWWGYSTVGTPAFAWKAGPQMHTFQNLVDYIRDPTTMLNNNNKN